MHNNNSYHNNNYNDAVSLSRATSVSRTSKQGSTVSRNQSLIKKNVAPQDLRPSDILIERFVAWKAIVKQLIAYFEVCLCLPFTGFQMGLMSFFRALRILRTIPLKS